MTERTRGLRSPSVVSKESSRNSRQSRMEHPHLRGTRKSMAEEGEIRANSSTLRWMKEKMLMKHRDIHSQPSMNENSSGGVRSVDNSAGSSGFQLNPGDFSNSNPLLVLDDNHYPLSRQSSTPSSPGPTTGGRKKPFSGIVKKEKKRKESKKDRPSSKGDKPSQIFAMPLRRLSHKTDEDFGSISLSKMEIVPYEDPRDESAMNRLTEEQELDPQRIRQAYNDNQMLPSSTDFRDIQRRKEQMTQHEGENLLGKLEDKYASNNVDANAEEESESENDGYSTDEI